MKAKRISEEQFNSIKLGAQSAPYDPRIWKGTVREFFEDVGRRIDEYEASKSKPVTALLDYLLESGNSLDMIRAYDHITLLQDTMIDLGRDETLAILRQHQHGMMVIAAARALSDDVEYYSDDMLTDVRDAVRERLARTEDRLVADELGTALEILLAEYERRESQYVCQICGGDMRDGRAHMILRYYGNPGMIGDYPDYECDREYDDYSELPY